MATSSAATGWPFLVASGRRRDYSTLLAPEFLVADLDYGILTEVVEPTPEDGPATVTAARTRGGRELTIVYATHLLRAVDVAVPETVPGVAAPAPRDEHNRPLRLMFGFVSPGVRVSEPAGADLSLVRAAALTVYRRFLADEEGFSVVPSRPFPLRSAVTAPRPTVPPPAPDNGRAPVPRVAVWLAGLAVVACAAVIAVVLGIGHRSAAPDPLTCPSAAQTADPQPVPSPSPSCEAGRPK